MSNGETNPLEKIIDPHDRAMDALADCLTQMAGELTADSAWVGNQLARCGQAGVFEWFLDESYGGSNWSQQQIIEGYLRLSAACLTTTFVITQRVGACKRIASSDNERLKQEFLPGLASGELFATVGISHLTTSRRHLAEPVLRATRRDGGFELNGYCPWVTGGEHADAIVIGATLPDDDQILLLVPSDAERVTFPEPPRLLALNASRTGQVHFDRTFVDETFRLAGPHPNVMQVGAGAGTGGLQTSTLAVGLARSATRYLVQQSESRDEFAATAAALDTEWEQLHQDLVRATAGDPDCSSEEIRSRANSLCLRSSQAAMAAAKGAGFMESHPAGRWCREALFFLVWSCPQPVMQANLCELANIQ